MLAKRIIPTILCKGRQMIKGQRFNAWRSVGLAAQAVRIHQARGVDELVLLDIGATPENRGPDLTLVAELTEKCFSPLTVGGGVQTLDHVKALMDAGADKVAICTAAFHHEVIEQASARYGSQAIVAAMDCKDGHVYSECGKEQWAMGHVSQARFLEQIGAGEILLTAIDREGTMEGYDLRLITEVSEAIGIPVIAHGGCGGYEHMRQAIDAGASAVAAGAIFQFTDFTPRGAAQYLQEHGVTVRT